MAIPRKPIKDAEEFIKTAKVEEKSKNDREIPQVKKFLIELPYDLWKKLKVRAVNEGKPLKDVILDILKEGAD